MAGTPGLLRVGSSSKRSLCVSRSEQGIPQDSGVVPSHSSPALRWVLETVTS